jgi:predicted transposase/invertase (TIGR01784 family)
MQSKTQLAYEIEKTENMASYDNSCKNLLSHKKILAYIMKECVEEFKGMELNYIAENCIENTPEISTEAVHRNTKSPEKIIGDNTEDKTIDEGTVFYDIRFVATVPSTGESIRLIINLEAQKDYNPGYAIVRRGLYYCSRLISSQYETEFTGSNYNHIKKVYSIWVCTNTPQYSQNTITKYKITEENIIGNVKENVQDYDLMNVIIVSLDKDDERVTQQDGILGLLRTLLSDEMSATTRKQILCNNYGIEDVIFEKELSGMCDLSYGVLEHGMEKGFNKGVVKGKEEGLAEGRAEGKAEGILISLRNLIEGTGFSFDKAADMLKISEEEREKYRNKI